MSKFNVFNDDNIKKQPDVKLPRVRPEPRDDGAQEPSERRMPIVIGRVNDYYTRPEPPAPVRAVPPVTLALLLTETLGMPNEAEVTVNVGDDTFTLLRPIVGNRYYNAVAIEFVMSAPGQYLRLQSLRALAHNNTDLGAIFRIHSNNVINIEVDRVSSRVTLST